jgi:hypothetical protein
VRRGRRGRQQLWVVATHGLTVERTSISLLQCLQPGLRVEVWVAGVGDRLSAACKPPVAGMRDGADCGPSRTDYASSRPGQATLSALQQERRSTFCLAPHNVSR